MNKELKRSIIHRIMGLEYSYYEPWCKVLQLEDFDETYFTGSLADESWRKYHQEDIDTVHHYIKEPENPLFRDAFMRYFLYRLFVDYTPESMDTEDLIGQEWQMVSRPEAELRLDHIIVRSLEELKDFYQLSLEEISEEENTEKFRSLKSSFLDVFTDNVIFLVNTDPDDDMPAVIGIDRETIGIYFLSN